MKSTLIQLGAAAAAIGSICGLVLMFGLDLPPYASMARAENIEQSLEVQNQQILENSLFVWEARRDDAEYELARDPEDSRAANELRRAKIMIHRIECQLEIGENCGDVQ